MTMKTKSLIFMIILLMVVSIPVQASYIDLIQSKNTVSPERAMNYAEAIVEYGTQYDINTDTLMALAWHESHFRNIQSRVCVDKRTGRIVDIQYCINNPSRYEREVSCGIFQIKPGTFEDVMNYPPNGDTIEEKCQSMIYDYKTTIHASVKYLAQKKKKHNSYGMISAYNAGTVTESNDDYVRFILIKKEKVEDFY